MNHINNLPTDILYQVFEYLPDNDYARFMLTSSTIQVLSKNYSRRGYTQDFTFWLRIRASAHGLSNIIQQIGANASPYKLNLRYKYCGIYPSSNSSIFLNPTCQVTESVISQDEFHNNILLCDRDTAHIWPHGYVERQQWKKLVIKSVDNNQLLAEISPFDDYYHFMPLFLNSSGHLILQGLRSITVGTCTYYNKDILLMNMTNKNIKLLYSQVYWETTPSVYIWDNYMYLINTDNDNLLYKKDLWSGIDQVINCTGDGPLLFVEFHYDKLFCFYDTHIDVIHLSTMTKILTLDSGMKIFGIYDKNILVMARENNILLYDIITLQEIICQPKWMVDLNIWEKNLTIQDIDNWYFYKDSPL